MCGFRPNAARRGRKRGLSGAGVNLGSGATARQAFDGRPAHGRGSAAVHPEQEATMKRLLTGAAAGLLALAGLAFAATPARADHHEHWGGGHEHWGGGHHAYYHGGWGHHDWGYGGWGRHRDWDDWHHRYWYPYGGRYWYPSYGAYYSPYVYSPYYAYPDYYYGYSGPYVNFWVTP
jgi:hypothetical protein